MVRRVRPIGVMLAAMLLVTACSSGGSASPSAAATAAPTASPGASQATPEASAAPSAAPSTAKVAIIPGGPHPYFAPMEQAIADAVKDFGLAGGIYKFPPQWELTAQNQIIETLVSQGYTAFGIFPGDANGTNAVIDELDSKGIPVIDTAGCTSQPTKARFCLATDVGNSAYLGTKALIDAMGGKGTIVHVTGFLVDPNTKLRMDAVEKAVAETNGSVKLLQHLTDIDSQEAADKAINSLLAAKAAEIDGIIGSAYVPSVVSATALRNIGDKRIKLVGIDDDPIVLQGIKDGFVVGSMSQNPYGQAYIAGYVLDLFLRGCTMKPDAPFLIDSGTFLINADNADTYQDTRKQVTTEILGSFKDKYLNCP